MVEQPSILSSLRSPMASATIEPIPPDRLGGLGTFSPVSPTEERSPDAVSSASEATEIGQSSQITKLWITFKNQTSELHIDEYDMTDRIRTVKMHIMQNI